LPQQEMELSIGWLLEENVAENWLWIL